jgi:hypothetical protein
MIRAENSIPLTGTGHWVFQPGSSCTSARSIRSLLVRMSVVPGRFGDLLLKLSDSLLDWLLGLLSFISCLLAGMLRGMRDRKEPGVGSRASMF